MARFVIIPNRHGAKVYEEDSARFAISGGAVHEDTTAAAAATSKSYPLPSLLNPGFTSPNIKPTVPVEIDWTNSLVGQTRALNVLRQGHINHDLIQGPLTPTGTVSYNRDYASSTGDSNFLTYPTKTISGDLSITIRCEPASGAASTESIPCGGDDGNDFIWLRDGSYFRVWFNGAGGATDFTAVTDFSGLNTWTLVRRGTTGEVYKNGVLQESKTVSSNTFKFVELFAGYQPNRTYSYNGDIHWFHIENRGYSAEEVRSYHDNLYQVLRPAIPMQFFVEGAAATTVGQASETDSALSVTPVKQVAVGQPSEADSALSVTPAKSTSIGQASETDAALSVSPARIVDVGQATETDTALSISTSTTAEVGLSSESDSALSVTPSKVVNVGIASETDSALTITPSGVTAVGQATETDTALNIDPLKQVNLGQPSETDTALSITPARGVSVGLASEADSALGITHRKEVQVGLASETDTAISITDGSPSPLQVTCTLVTRSGAAIPNLTALSWAWFDAVDPNLFGAPSDQGEVETTDGSGVIEVSLPSTTLTAGQSGTLVLRADDGSSLGAYNLAVASA
jgi:hypothetical protein